LDETSELPVESIVLQDISAGDYALVTALYSITGQFLVPEKKMHAKRIQVYRVNTLTE
jgi:hypothetical protein